MALTLSAPEQFMNGVMKRLSIPITSTTTQAFSLWLEKEQGAGFSAFGQNQGNPLGIQTSAAQEAGKTGDMKTGIALTAQLLKSHYPEIVNAFKASDATTESIGQAIVNSPWNNGKTDGSGYGGIASFMGTGAPTTGTTSAPIDQPLSSGHQAAPPTNGLAGNQPGAAPSQITEGMNSTYTGPNAYKGFDLTSIAKSGSPEVMKQVKNAIDYFTANPQLEQKMISDIYQAYGTEAWLASIPEIRTLLVAGTYNDWTKDPALFKTLFQDTQWYKTTAPSMRLWQENLANDPAAAQNAVNQASARVTNIAQSLGVPLTSQQIQQIGTNVAQMSIDGNGTYVNGLLPDQNIYQMVTGAFNATTFQQGLQGNSATGAATASTPQGDAAYLYNQFQSLNRNYMLGLTNSQIAQKVQDAIKNDTGQANFLTGQVQGFQSQAQATAQNLYPAFAGAIGTSATGGNDQTPYAATAPYRALIAQYTGQANADTVNLLDPQWSWVLSGKAPPVSRAAGLLSPGQTGNGTSASAGSSSSPTPPTIDQMQQYLMGTPQFQSTDMAKNMAWHVGSQILKSFGYN